MTENGTTIEENNGGIIDETEKCLISYRDNFPDTKIPEKIYDVLKQLMPLMWW